MMKCNTCKFNKMCYLSRKYLDMVTIAAEITDTHEPEYGIACKYIEEIYKGCIYFEVDG